jgi:hypothetical protein
MTSYLGWLDASESDRRRAMEFVAGLREPDTLDELGIGPARDAIADRLFPGTSTVQTRARYLLFVPWVYLMLEGRDRGSRDVAVRARNIEIRLAKVLAAGADADGAIGKEAKDRLLRLPSSIYWAGLGRYQIRRFDGSQAAYHRALARPRPASPGSAADESSDERPAPDVRANWDPHLPPAPASFPDGVTLALEPGEAAFLADSIQFQCRGSMLARLLEIGRTWTHVDAPWMHSAVPEMSDALRALLHDAELLSAAHHGAALLYNFLVARAAGREKLEADFRDGLEEWNASIGPTLDELRRWDLAAFWSGLRTGGTRIAPRLERFVGAWRDEVVASAGTVADRTTAHDLITRREIEVKGRRARLTNPTYRELWNGGSSLRSLAYRWNPVETILLDILRALPTGGADARPA